MSNGTTKILLVEDNPGDARLIREMLAESNGGGFELDWAPQLSTGLEKLAQGGTDLVLLDLGLPDSRGIETFIKAYAQAPQVPFVVLTGLDDETVALTAVREGAQDYLVKGQTDSGMLLRAIRYATERKKIEEELRREIEERRAAEMAVVVERQRLYALLDGLPAFVSLIAPDFTINFANQVFEEIFGNWKGKHCYEVIFDQAEACEGCPAVQVLANHTLQVKEMSVPRNGCVYNIYKYPFDDVDGATLVLSMGIDITQRKRAEAALEAERQRLYSLLDGLPGLVYLKAPDFSLSFANRRFREICGDWEGKRCYEAIFKRQEPCENCTQYRVLETGEPSVKEATYAESNRTYQIHSYPFADVDGSSLVLTLGIDITERKEAEETLKQSETRLAEAQRLAHLGHWEWDLQSGEVIWSEEVYRIFGLTPEGFTPSPKANLSYVHPEDQPRVSKSFEDALAGVKPYNLVNRLVRPDGSVRYVHSQAEVVFENGKARRMVGTAQDITERRTAERRLQASEARFRAIFEGAGIGIAMMNLEGRIMAANTAQHTMLGYRDKELWGKTFLEITHPEDRIANLRLFKELMAGRRDDYQIEKRLVRQDGSDFWVQVHTTLVRGPEGEPRYCIGTTEDITARKEAREKLWESEQNLRHLASQLMTAQEDERKRISRELHDELGQSLLVLKMQTRVIERGLGPDEAQLRGGCLEMLDNLDRVVDNVRRLSRDLSPLIIEDLGLSAGLRRLIQDFSKLYGLEYSAPEDADIDDLFPLPVQVAIYRIFQESLTNIGKHSQATKLTITMEQTGESVSFVIQDNGRGFEPAPRGQTEGMGLAAMEERARMAGGTLSIWSQEGAGSRIRFEIPYSPKHN